VTPTSAYWTSFAVMWAVTIFGAFVIRYWIRRLRMATAEMIDRAESARADAPLAEWCRHMSLTVITHTGTVFSTTFAELQASEAPTFRNWNVPMQITVWSDLADEELIAEARVATALQDGTGG